MRLPSTVPACGRTPIRYRLVTAGMAGIFAFVGRLPHGSDSSDEAEKPSNVLCSDPTSVRGRPAASRPSSLASRLSPVAVSKGSAEAPPVSFPSPTGTTG